MKRINIKNILWGGILVSILVVLGVYLFVPTFQQFQLTDEEIEWLKEHPVIKIAPNSNFKPVEFFEVDGTYSGFSADIFKIIEQRLGIKFNVVRYPGVEEIHKAMEALDIDVITTTSLTSAKENYLLFSEPLIKLQKVIVVNSSDKRELNADSLNGMRVAVVKHFSVQESIIEEAPNAVLDTLTSALECLYEVSLRRSDAAIMNLATAAFLIENHNLYNLRIAGDYSAIDPYAIAVRKDWPELVEIFNKVILSIPQDEHNKIIQQWIGLRLEHIWWKEIPWQWIVLIFGFIGSASVIILLWSKSLKIQVENKTRELNHELNERKKVEKALRESEERFRSIVNLLPEAVFITNQYCDFKDINRAASNLLGYSHEDLMGKNASIVFNQNDMCCIKNNIAQKPEKIGSFEITICKKDGTPIPAEAAILEIIINGENCYLGVLRDISLYKKAEEKMLESQQALKDLNVAKDKIFSIISHDLRSPFLGIMGFLEILKNSYGEISQDEYDRIISILESSLKALLSLLEDLLKWSQIQMGRLQITIKDFELNDIIKKSVEELESAATNKQIKIKLDITPNIIFKTDYNIISSVIRNLLSNAVKFTNRGGMINLFSQQDEENTIIIIEDNGVGIEEERLPNLFKLDNVYSTKGTENEKGSGLGLIIVKEMLNKLNGTISINSRVNEGTKCIVALPNLTQS